MPVPGLDDVVVGPLLAVDITIAPLTVAAQFSHFYLKWQRSVIEKNERDQIQKDKEEILQGRRDEDRSRSPQEERGSERDLKGDTPVVKSSRSFRDSRIYEYPDPLPHGPPRRLNAFHDHQQQQRSAEAPLPLLPLVTDRRGQTLPPQIESVYCSEDVNGSSVANVNTREWISCAAVAFGVVDDDSGSGFRFQANCPLVLSEHLSRSLNAFVHMKEMDPEVLFTVAVSPLYTRFRETTALSALASSPASRREIFSTGDLKEDSLQREAHIADASTPPAPSPLCAARQRLFRWLFESNALAGSTRTHYPPTLRRYSLCGAHQQHLQRMASVFSAASASSSSSGVHTCAPQGQKVHQQSKYLTTGPVNMCKSPNRHSRIYVAAAPLLYALTLQRPAPLPPPWHSDAIHTSHTSASGEGEIIDPYTLERCALHASSSSSSSAADAPTTTAAEMFHGEALRTRRLRSCVIYGRPAKAPRECDAPSADDASRLWRLTTEVEVCPPVNAEREGKSENTGGAFAARLQWSVAAVNSFVASSNQNEGGQDTTNHNQSHPYQDQHFHFKLLSLGYGEAAASALHILDTFCPPGGFPSLRDPSPSLVAPASSAPSAPFGTSSPSATTKSTGGDGKPPQKASSDTRSPRPVFSMMRHNEEVLSILPIGFQIASKEGPLVGEPVAGVSFTLVDATLTADALHRGAGQIIPATRRACYGAFLQAAPMLLEPYFTIAFTMHSPLVHNNDALQESVALHHFIKVFLMGTLRQALNNLAPPAASAGSSAVPAAAFAEVSAEACLQFIDDIAMSHACCRCTNSSKPSEAHDTSSSSEPAQKGQEDTLLCCSLHHALIAISAACPSASPHDDTTSTHSAPAFRAVMKIPGRFTGAFLHALSHAETLVHVETEPLGRERPFSFGGSEALFAASCPENHHPTTTTTTGTHCIFGSVFSRRARRWHLGDSLGQIPPHDPPSPSVPNPSVPNPSVSGLLPPRPQSHSDDRDDDSSWRVYLEGSHRCGSVHSATSFDGWRPVGILSAIVAAFSTRPTTPINIPQKEGRARSIRLCFDIMCVCAPTTTNANVPNGGDVGYRTSPADCSSYALNNMLDLVPDVFFAAFEAACIFHTHCVASNNVCKDAYDISSLWKGHTLSKKNDNFSSSSTTACTSSLFEPKRLAYRAFYQEVRSFSPHSSTSTSTAATPTQSRMHHALAVGCPMELISVMRTVRSRRHAGERASLPGPYLYSDSL